ncbi:MAG: YceD family protein [Bacteroidia bacterium]
MKPPHPYGLLLNEIPLGETQHQWHLNCEFLCAYPENTLEDLSATFDITVERSPKLLILSYDLRGQVQLPCDRCGASYYQPIEGRFRQYYALQSDVHVIPKDWNEEFEVLPHNLSWLDLRQVLYDYVMVSIPIHRVPTDCPSSRCDQKALAYLAKDTSPEEDPRWTPLKNLLKKP